MNMKKNAPRRPWVWPLGSQDGDGCSSSQGSGRKRVTRTGTLGRRSRPAANPSARPSACQLSAVRVSLSVCLVRTGNRRQGRAVCWVLRTTRVSHYQNGNTKVEPEHRVSSACIFLVGRQVLCSCCWSRPGIRQALDALTMPHPPPPRVTVAVAVVVVVVVVIEVKVISEVKGQFESRQGSCLFSRAFNTQQSHRGFGWWTEWEAG
ncbi:hypothetical protein F4777DRAFT_275563 [Nemania sp. FL0916]|nr:hypothetical protein F4777DRAFT_275563 [Nemania sp. FL0916]